MSPLVMMGLDTVRWIPLHGTRTNIIQDNHYQDDRSMQKYGLLSPEKEVEGEGMVATTCICVIFY
jgi:hypothetical protein